MPYISRVRRLIFREVTDKIYDIFVTNHLELQAGDLNYLFTMISKNYIGVKGENYQNYNDLIGSLEACKLELYRRRTAPYEDEKIAGNGDV